MTSTAVNSAPAPTYRARLAANSEDVRAAQRLRFEVFNLELNEGLSESWQTYMDVDRFDEACDHLLVEHTPTGAVVGTYRLQTGTMAASKYGYYSEQEFDFSPYESVRSETVELGRACVHVAHRKMNVLNMLWRGIAEYALQRQARYLIGCSSLTSQDPALGHAMYQSLAPDYLVREHFRTLPLEKYRLPEVAASVECSEPPRLLRAYLSIGARICGPAALDQEFGTIDFLTLIDLRDMPATVQSRFIV
jgi:putative hemolysin